MRADVQHEALAECRLLAQHAVARDDLEVPDEGTSCPEVEGGGTGSIRDQLVNELVKAGLDQSLAECVIDGVIAKVGSSELDRMVLDQDMGELGPLIQAQTINCASKGD